MRFEFSTAHRIIFGPGVAEQIPELVAGHGTRAFLVLGGTPGRLARITGQIAARGVACESFRVVGEPTTELVRAAVASARQMAAQVVVALGGGSVLDTGKAVAALLANEGGLTDYLEVVGKGQPLRHQAAPCIAVPTTAGTGAEATYNAVLSVPEQHVKVSMRSPLMLPRWAVVDPLLTLSLPPALTAGTGLDALTQLIEAFVSNKANPLTDGVCREGLPRAGRSLRRAFEDGSDAGAREDMALASLFSGMALANARLGAVHGFAGPLGGMTNAPHGVICGKLLPYVMQANVRALQEQAAGSRGASVPARQDSPCEDARPTLTRYDEVARMLTGRTNADASDGVAWIEDLCAIFALPGLRQYGLTEADFPLLVEKAGKASSMKGNPVELRGDELLHILQQVID
jgi:alcohol dehydrogenase class IV